MKVILDWTTYNSVITQATVGMTFLEVVRTEKILYKFYTPYNNVILYSQMSFDNIEDAMMFEESFLKKAKIIPAIIEEDKTSLIIKTE